MEYLFYLVQFTILFLVCFLYYRLIALKGITKKNKSKRNRELPEVKLFIIANKINMKKVKYLDIAKKVTNLVSFDLALTVCLTFNLSENIFGRIVICVVILFITTFISYKLLSHYYKKKGLIEDVQSQENRK